MNAISNQSCNPNDWVINYLEVNSRPAPADDFRRLRMTQSEIRIDPVGIVLSLGEITDDGIFIESGTTKYFGKIVQRGNELIVRLTSVDNSEQLLFVATKSVCAFEPKGLNRVAGRIA